MNRYVGRTAAGLVVALGLSLLSTPSYSQEGKLVLRVADHLPANHFLVGPLVKYWMDAVSKDSGGEVTFEYYPAEQLGKAKDMLSLAQSGVTDIAGVVPAYVSDKLPLSVVAELPGSFDTSCRGTEAYLPLIYEGGILALKEFRALGFRPLFAIVLPPYQIFARHQIATLKSFEGWKIQTAGGAKELMIRKINAVPIRMAAPEIYEALSRGTIDGGTLATGSILSYNLLGPAKAVTIGENFGSIVAIWGMSEARWSKLPERLRRIMIEAGNHASRNMCRLADEGVQADYRKMKEHGLTVVALPPEDRKEINSLAAAVRNEWKQALEERGKAASEVLRDFSERVAAQR